LILGSAPPPALLGGVTGVSSGGRAGRSGVITAIFKESQLKFLDTEKEPSPPIDYLISSILIIFAKAT